MEVQFWAASVPRTRMWSYPPIYNEPGVAGSIQPMRKPKLFDGTIPLVQRLLVSRAPLVMAPSPLTPASSS